MRRRTGRPKHNRHHESGFKYYQGTKLEMRNHEWGKVATTSPQGKGLKLSVALMMVVVMVMKKKI
jgi:hypothetical protein